MPHPGVLDDPPSGYEPAHSQLCSGTSIPATKPCICGLSKCLPALRPVSRTSRSTAATPPFPSPGLGQGFIPLHHMGWGPVSSPGDGRLGGQLLWSSFYNGTNSEQWGSQCAGRRRGKSVMSRRLAVPEGGNPGNWPTGSLPQPRGLIQRGIPNDLVWSPAPLTHSVIVWRVDPSS